MNLYEIDRQIQELIENSVDPETGELTLDPAALDALQMEREVKIENLACYVKNLTADAKAIKAEEQALSERRRAAENKAERLKRYLSDVLDGEKFSTSRVAISWRKTNSVQVDENLFLSSTANELIPGAITYEPKISKTAIKKAIEQGQTVIGAELVSNMSMSIK